MADHVIVERTDRGSSTATGVMVGVVLVALIGVVALFFVIGGPGRFAGSPAAPPSNTNINLPAQGQQPASGPNISVPKQIDVNINQPAQPQAPAGGNR